MPTYDIVIVGGGMVGASLAALLPDNLKVLVIESFALSEASLASYQPSFDGRSTALSYDSYQILQKAAIWPMIAPYAQAILDVHVSDKGHWGSVNLNYQQQGWPALGYVLENALLGRALLHAIQALDHVTLLCPAKVVDLQVLSDGVDIAYQHQEHQAHVKAHLLVIADGANSDSCRLLGIEHQRFYYQHSAIVANISTDKAHQGIAYERFAQNGPIALLPQIDTAEDKHRSALIWTLPEPQANELLALDDHAFLAQLQQRFGAWQGRFVKVGKRSGYPLVLSQAKEQIRQHIVVLGNAAHSLHPVAGQGFNLALRDVQRLVQVLKKAQKQQQALGKLSVLNDYLEQQKNDQYLTILFSDKLPSVFAQTSLAIQLGRNLALLGLELSPSLKQAFTRFAAGLRQREGIR